MNHLLKSINFTLFKVFSVKFVEKVSKLFIIGLKDLWNHRHWEFTIATIGIIHQKSHAKALDFRADHSDPVRNEGLSLASNHLGALDYFEEKVGCSCENHALILRFWNLNYNFMHR